MQKTQNRHSEEKNIKTYSDLKELVKRNVLGVGVTNASKENILEFIVSSVRKGVKPYYIVTPNPEIIVLANKNKDYQTVLNNAKLALNDGVGVGLAARILGKPLEERFTGVELVEKVCEKCNDWPITVGFLGGRSNVAELAAECLKRQFPNLHVVMAQSEWNENKKPIDILFVAFGAPKQELWMAKHLEKIPVKVMVGVGGALDYISGRVPRAPRFVRSLGFEWLFRLIIQPWRWKRQLALVEFMWMVLNNRIQRT